MQELIKAVPVAAEAGAQEEEVVLVEEVDQEAQVVEVLEVLAPEVLEVLAPEVLVLEVLAPEVLEVLAPEVLEVLAPEVLEVLAPEVLEVLVLEVLEVLAPGVLEVLALEARWPRSRFLWPRSTLIATSPPQLMSDSKNHQSS